MPKIYDKNIFYIVIPSFQIISCFGFFIFISFTIYLDIVYVYMNSKSYAPKKSKRFTIWNGGSIYLY
jgi:hypothetical protein